MTAPGDEVWDVVVVGAGAAGCALAARLSEDPWRRVLVLEAGPFPSSAAAFPADALDAATIAGAGVGHPLNWAHDATLREGRPYSLARGRVAGGSTTINGGYFVRPRRADHEVWAGLGGREWSREACLPALERLETDAQYGTDALHGSSGPMPVTRAPIGPDGSGGTAGAAAFVRSARAAGLPFEADKNSEQPIGVGPLPMNLRDGERWNAALAYLLPPVGVAAGRPNLELRGETTVRRVVLRREGSRAGTPRAVGVEVVRDGVVSTVRAREVVLAAGALATPVLLLRSGVGPRDELVAAGVSCEVDSPRVGRGLSDHPQVQVTWLDGSRPPQQRVPSMEVVVNTAVGEAGDEVEVLPLTRPMSELLAGPGADAGSGTGSGAASTAPGTPRRLTALVALQTSRSRGRIRLVAGTGEPEPRIDLGYLDDARDRAALRAGVRLTAGLLCSPAFDGVVSEVLPDEAVVGDDELLDAWILDHLGTALHSCGTAAFGGPSAVTDGVGRVNGVDGLRIADLSIVPTAPRRGPALTAVLVGERVSDFMRSGR
ncbi:GMC family oxidoreductase N-terminal domain-containing protein [Herbiconiux sp. KACC 21604]|uniref:GMC family oxidoreductase n=1 Tax=unclassified Herbiconiux TaxID=2618217 RepID=UPI001491F36C|nr:GMC family oxidoreductase N-terminal domain-containing protein [Herbiconiux sp. SALV-R1]QJU53190.1 FAD-binding protein [Herbiconiux sp. SALV-R1]WPO88138.1 GMC family oxidoreductase N-terminal domain-containing protein [Herbiconiux sp. KACC 21604]